MKEQGQGQEQGVKEEGQTGGEWGRQGPGNLQGNLEAKKGNLGNLMNKR